MLAENYMSAEALGITEEVKNGMILTLRAFERGQITAFDMHTSGDWDNLECGSPCCIRGWAMRLTRNVALFPCSLSEFPRGLRDLFYPEEAAISCRDPAKGASALRNYLTTGEPRWEEVMSE